MSLPESGTIKLSEIKTEFEKSNNLLDYLGEGGVTGSAPLKLTDFYGTSAEVDPIFGDTSLVGSGAGRHNTFVGIGYGSSFARDMNSNWLFGSEYSYGYRSIVRQFMPTMIDCRPGSPYSGERYKLIINYDMNDQSILQSRGTPNGSYKYGYHKSATNSPLTGFNTADDQDVKDEGVIRSYGGSLYGNVTDIKYGTLPDDGFVQMYIEVTAGYEPVDNGLRGLSMSIRTATWELRDPARALERVKKFLKTKKEERS